MLLILRTPSKNLPFLIPFTYLMAFANTVTPRNQTRSKKGERTGQKIIFASVNTEILSRFDTPAKRKKLCARRVNMDRKMLGRLLWQKYTLGDSARETRGRVRLECVMRRECT